MTDIQTTVYLNDVTWFWCTSVKGLLKCFCAFCVLDIIDENLKTALQKDLNAMAPGLTIQVKVALDSLLW